MAKRQIAMPSFSRFSPAGLFLAILSAQAGVVQCQSTLPAQVAGLAASPVPSDFAGLPDSPGSSVTGTASAFRSDDAVPDQNGSTVAPQIAPKYLRVVKAGQTAVPLTSADKMTLSLRQRITPVAQASTFVSVGLSHLTDSRPHYGSDSAGFGERLGAAELRQATQSFLTNGLYASIFHDDPRYYVLGSTHPFKQRAVYAASRIVITRKDNGSRAINFPQLLGIASSQAIANSYYPTRDQSVRRTVTGTISSYGTTAAFNEVNEFLGDVIAHFRHRKQP